MTTYQKHIQWIAENTIKELFIHKAHVRSVANVHNQLISYEEMKPKSTFPLSSHLHSIPLTLTAIFQ